MICDLAIRFFIGLKIIYKIYKQADTLFHYAKISSEDFRLPAASLVPRLWRDTMLAWLQARSKAYPPVYLRSVVGTSGEADISLHSFSLVQRLVPRCSAFLPRARKRGDHAKKASQSVQRRIGPSIYDMLFGFICKTKAAS